MSIAWINFTPWASLGAGALIGLSVSVFVLGYLPWACGRPSVYRALAISYLRSGDAGGYVRVFQPGRPAHVLMGFDPDFY